MAFDLYVGSLARYYLGSWENKAQQYARENNLPYNIIRPEKTSDEDENNLSEDEVVEIVRNWFSSLSNSFNINFNEFEKFQSEYFTERVENFELLLLANYLLFMPGEDVKNLTNKRWTNEIKKKIDMSSDFMHFKNTEIWFPVDFPGSGIYEIEFPNGQQKTVCSVSVLIKEIDAISQRVFNCSISELGNEFSDELISLRSDLLKINYGARFSLESKLPIILDF